MTLRKILTEWRAERASVLTPDRIGLAVGIQIYIERALFGKPLTDPPEIYLLTGKELSFVAGIMAILTSESELWLDKSILQRPQSGALTGESAEIAKHLLDELKSIALNNADLERLN